MKLTIEEISDTRKKLVVNITGDDIAEAEKSIFNSFKKDVRLPGFRPGKAPEGMIRKKYAKEMKEELLRKVTSDAYKHAESNAGFDIYTVAEVENDGIGSGADVDVSFVVDVFPSFELPAYEGLKTEVPSTEVSDEEVTNELDNIRKQRADFKVVERAAEKGDYVKISYEGKIDDQAIAELVPANPIYGKQENTWEEVGTEEGYGVKAIIEGAVGTKAGDKKEVEMDFPEDFEVKELAGKKAVYSFEVHEVRERALPELNEEFLKSLGVADEAELKTRIKEMLESRKKQEKYESQREQVSEALDKAVDFALPQSALEVETQNIMREIMTQNMNRGVSQEEFEKHKEEIHSNAQKGAVTRVKLQLILGKIAEKEKINVTQEDFQRYVMTAAYQTREKPEKIVKELQKDQNRLNEVRRSLLFGKTLDHVIGKSEEAVKSA